MDAVIVREPSGLVCRKLRDIRRGDSVLCGGEAVHVHPPQRDREGHKNHMRAINRINGHGSLKKAVDAGELT